MKMFDIDGKLVIVNINPSTYPIRAKSRSKLQGKVAEYLSEKYPYDVILEDFTIPGSKMSVDFFLPKRGEAWEINGRQHFESIPFYHGDKLTSNGFAKQVVRDRKKAEWAEVNGFKFIEINNERDFEQLAS